jgi:uncharacterized membrane protein YqjE
MSDIDDESGRRGLGASLRGLIANTLGLISSHAQLLGVELQQEKERIAALAVLGSIALVMFGMVMLLVTFLIIAAVWDGYRLQVIAGLTLLYAIIGVGAALGIRRKLHSYPNPFAATASEIEKDIEHLRR